LPAWRRLARTGVALAATTALLAACGGGDQVKKFKPANIVSFGDEASALVTETVGLSGGGTGTVHGLKYGVNDVSLLPNIKADLISVDRAYAPSTAAILANASQTSWTAYPTVTRTVTGIETPSASDVVVVQYEDLPTLVINGTTTSTEAVDINYRYLYSCYDNPLWIQIVARRYGKGYNSQCPLEGGTGAVTYAEGGAKVAAVATQVAAHRGELNSETLVTLMAGQNDVLELYAQLKANAITLDSARAELRNRGGALAAIANDIIKTGARVLLVRLPDLGLSPLAREDGRTRDLTALTLAFNEGILNKITNDGRKIALFNFYDYTNYMDEYVRDNRTYDNIGNMSAPLCSDTVYKPDATQVAGGSVAPLYAGDGLLYCNTWTLNSGASTTSYFWASKTNMGPAAHSSLGTRAYDLADNNPL
jgi:hypothetical protein